MAAAIVRVAIPPHNGWLTMDDVCVFSGLDPRLTAAGCALLASEGTVELKSTFVVGHSTRVRAVRRATSDTVDVEPLKEWLREAALPQCGMDLQVTSVRLRVPVGLLEQVLDGVVDRLLIDTVDAMFVAAGSPHQFTIRYPLVESPAAHLDGVRLDLASPALG